jgi:hypothetical protein
MKHARSVVAIIALGAAGSAFGAHCSDTAVPNKDASAFARAGGWDMSNTSATRRKLIQDQDIVKFEDTGGNKLKLTVIDPNATAPGLVLGKKVVFTLDPAKGVATAKDADAQYGRTMHFAFRKQASGTETLCYDADYVEGPQNQPDESGDGKPH